MNEQEKYIQQLHKAGMRFVIVGALLMLSVPLIISLITSAWPTGELMLKGFMSVGVIYIPIGIIEFFNYAPMLGVGGTYVAEVTGNISNMKLPAALSAMKQAGVEPGSDEAEIISSLAIATSSIVTTVVILLGVLILVPFQDFFIEQLLPVSIYMIPAIFGALGVVFIARHWRLTIVPSIVMLVLFMFVIRDDSIRPALVPIASLISIGSARFFFKKGWIK